jgi:hypothetical protein
LLQTLTYLARFSLEAIEILLEHAVFSQHEKNETLYIRRDRTYILIHGQIKLRDHANRIGSPLLCWLMQPGDYITYEIHSEICENPEIWTKAEKPADILAVPNDFFLEMMHKTRHRDKEILVEHLRTFGVVENLTIASIITFVYDIGTVRSFDKGELILI